MHFLMSQLAYVYSTGDEINGVKQYQALVTMDIPDGKLSDALVTRKGLVIKYDNQLYKLALPGEGGNNVAYKNSQKLTYKWKSKMFVFPGRITLAAAKIIHDCGHAVTFRLYIDCKLAWETEICDCLPFRLPPNLMGQEVEIEVEGISPIHKIKVASSMQELAEHE